MFEEPFKKHYRIPDGYFEHLENRWKSESKAKHLYLKRLIRVAAAALVFGLLLDLSYTYYKKRYVQANSYADSLKTEQFLLVNQKDSENDEFDMSDDIIEDYLLMDDEPENY